MILEVQKFKSYDAFEVRALQFFRGNRLNRNLIARQNLVNSYWSNAFPFHIRKFMENAKK